MKYIGVCRLRPPAKAFDAFGACHVAFSNARTPAGLRVPSQFMPHLPDAATFRALVDGSQRGLTPSLLRGLLAACALPYGAAVAARNRLYDVGWLPSEEADVPVICIGNLTLGGTGKTPLVAWLARLLTGMHATPAIISRGYAASNETTSDEAAELAMLLPGIPHVANRDRAAGVRTAIEKHKARVAVLDDGFQHRRLRRALDLIAIDATDPFGCGHLFPRGLLREPVAGLRRAGGCILTRATSVDHSRRATIREHVQQITAGRPLVWAEASHTARGLRCADSSTRPLTDLASRRVAIASGIGNPAAFRRTVEAAGGEVVAELIYPDHHPYPQRDREQIGQAAKQTSAELIVTTVKDLVKIQQMSLHDTPVVAVEIAIDILEGEPQLEALIRDAVSPLPPAHS